MSSLETGLLESHHESNDIGICRLCFVSQAELEKRHRQLTTLVSFVFVIWLFVITLVVIHSRNDVSDFKQLVASNVQDLNYQLSSQTQVLNSARQTIAYLQECTGCVSS